MVALPDLIIKPEHPSTTDTISHIVEQEYTPFESYNKKSTTEHIPFPDQVSELQTDLTFSMGSQDLYARIDEPNLFDVFGPLDAPEFGIMGSQYPLIGFPFFDPSGSGRIGTRDATIGSSKNSDSFFDDFPEDMFDHTEPPPGSPSKL